MRRGALVVVFGLIGLLAQARIGESRKACDLRYGEPVRVSDTGALVTYKTSTQSVAVHFTDGLADMVSHQKLPALSGESASPFTKAQLQEILRRNGGERVWVAGEETPEGTSWRTEDGELYARLDRRTNHMVVFTERLAATADADQDAEAAE